MIAVFSVPAQAGDNLLAKNPFFANRCQQAYEQCVHPPVAAKNHVVDAIGGLTISGSGRQYIANHIAQEHYRNAHDENLNELPAFMGYCRVRITGTRVKANILSGMATTYSGPEEASSTAQAGTSVPSSVRSASVARIFSPIQNTIIMASAEPIVENRRWAVNHQSRGDCCGCCDC